MKVHLDSPRVNFYIGSYDGSVPIFQIVVDFIEIFGGVY